MGIVCTQQVINFAAIVDSLLTLWLMLSVLDMLGEVPVAAAVRMDDNVSCPCHTFQGVGSLSGTEILEEEEEEEEEDWAAKQRNDREGGAGAIHLPPAAVASSTTGRKNSNNSWFSSSSSSSNGCVVSILESGANTSFIFYESWLSVLLS